uniref:Uncharacterized protein n=1 Tax=viral metagenome TaxID=1070528 RepID=A0A6M3JBU9_9ZZZZ
MAEPTRAELQAQLEVQQNTNALLTEALAAREKEHLELVGRGEGWLVQTPDPAFRGTRYGVRIVDGQAFILKTRKIVAFEQAPMSKPGLVKYIDTQFPAMVYTPEERLAATTAVLERERVSSAARAAEAFEKDLGYKVEWFGVDELRHLDARMQERVTESAQMQALNEARTQAEMLERNRR